ncbi:flagellar hook-associated protein FlgL [Photobacterium halotolerans]|uniref:Flagellar hook-associated protein 3 n=1 Tax=Photobacterium halotolerans TaxID=265726 RepID=A0A7X4WQS5_9GAMM|nr:flagellar hook-associated protein FlgL [Photobacterium halotolerans]NAW64730.1 flagellar hook-associated protein 3 [Photobacterium halotolerans]NAW86888.1 flagellar hook-associated protein 3 [Photobacterium halotolerans]NAX49225.1 flagellar hook-associated protein 3 [Photobacterium halotolerans]
MRISDTQFSQMMLSSLSKNNVGLGEVMQQMSTGDRLSKLSDDPIDSIKLLNLGREGSALAQYQANIANVKTTLSSQEAYLDTANSSLKSLRDLVLWGSNGTMTDEDRQGIITEMESLKEGLQAVFNAQDEEGIYLFSGTQTDTPALTDTGAGYTLNGNADKRLVTVAKGVTMESNVTALELLDLGGGDTVFQKIDDLIAEFQAPTANFRTEVNDTLAAIDTTFGNVLGAMTDMGGRHNNLDLMSDGHTDNKLFVDKVEGDLKNLDYAEASVRLSNYLSALQATQASFTKINDLSLFDRL